MLLPEQAAARSLIQAALSEFKRDQENLPGHLKQHQGILVMGLGNEACLATRKHCVKHAQSLGLKCYCCVLQAFADILASNETFAAPMEDTYKLLDLNPEDTTTLEQYLQVT